MFKKIFTVSSLTIVTLTGVINSGCLKPQASVPAPAELAINPAFDMLQSETAKQTLDELNESKTGGE